MILSIYLKHKYHCKKDRINR